MHFRLEYSQKNLIALSEADNFEVALKEWAFTGMVFQNEGTEVKCELCEQPDLLHRYEIQNSANSKKLLVGSSCILKFSSIQILDDKGRSLQNEEDRKYHLAEKLREKIIDVALAPLRKIYKANKNLRPHIKPIALRIKRDEGITPSEAAYIFHLMDKYEQRYMPEYYKISLRSFLEQAELSKINNESLPKIYRALTAAQRRKHAKLFSK